MIHGMRYELQYMAFFKHMCTSGQLRTIFMHQNREIIKVLAEINAQMIKNKCKFLNASTVSTSCHNCDINESHRDEMRCKLMFFGFFFVCFYGRLTGSNVMALVCGLFCNIEIVTEQ